MGLFGRRPVDVSHFDLGQRRFSILRLLDLKADAEAVSRDRLQIALVRFHANGRLESVEKRKPFDVA